jgi:hypothetical protein
VRERLAALALPGHVHVGRTAAEPVPRLSSGLPSIDTLLDGGVPRGRISELLGAGSSGKTSMLFALLAAVTRRGEVVACVDLTDALHPESILGAGADLHRLLWVRPRSLSDALRCTDLLLQAGGFAVVVLDLGPAAGVLSAGPLPDGSLRGAKSDRRLGAARLRSLPHHVWPRLLHAAERSHSALVVLTPQRVAGSFATLTLALQPRTPLWRQGAWPLFEGFETTLQVERSKLGAPGRSVGFLVKQCSK